MQNYKMLIGGQWTDALSGETFDVINPYTGKVYAKVPKAGIEDVDRVMSAAYEARKGWAATPALERAKIIYKAAQILEENQQEFADVLIDEAAVHLGKPCLK